MRPPWTTIERWGPFAVALISILTLIGYGWGNDQRVAKLEGVILFQRHELDQRAAAELHLRQEVGRLNNWAIAVYERGSAAGWKLPQPPKPKPAPKTVKEK